jgi:predicted ArsR family transcriptional regulator
VLRQSTEAIRTVPDDVQAQAKALGDPTRFRILRYVFEAARPVAVAELTTYTQLNHNAVRQHLEALTSAGLVVESLEERTRPGRPRLLYEASPDSAGLWGTPGPYEQLAGFLAQILLTGASPEDVGHQAGLARARRLSDRGPAPGAIGAIEHEMARAGFRPSRRERPRGIELVLERCPFETAAIANADAVCRLHLGLARGLAEGLGGVEVGDLVAKSPHKAGCRLLIKKIG